MAFDLLDTNPFATNFLSLDTTSRPGFTFDPELDTVEFNTWKKNFLDNLDVKTTPKVDAASAVNAYNTANISKTLAGTLEPLKARADKQLAGGAILKTAAAAGQLFSDLMVASSNFKNIRRQKENTKLDAENQMAALDNQVLYYKNQIADKFNQTLARSAVVMAAKNLRVTAGNLLEQTKGAAYDATKDIQTLESNAELKKIMLRSKQRQADITAKLQKSQEVTTLLGDAANLGLMVATGGGTFESWGDLFAGMGGTESLNDTVYGG